MLETSECITTSSGSDENIDPDPAETGSSGFTLTAVGAHHRDDDPSSRNGRARSITGPRSIQGMEIRDAQNRHSNGMIST